MTTCVYNYSNPLEFISDFIQEQKILNSTFSIRKWAKEMGLKSHNLLVMIINEKRSLRQKHMSFLSEGLKLSSSERMYFQTLIEYHNAEDEKEKRLYQHFLVELNPAKDFSIKEVDEFKIISDWHHMAILAMTELRNFKVSPETIVEHLKYSVDSTEIKRSIDRLKNLSLLSEDSDGSLKATYNRLTTKDDLLNEGAQEYHRQVSTLAVKAVTNDLPEVREFQSFSMSVRKDKVQLAKEMIREFRSKLSKAVSGDGDYIYQTNIQFFQLTESPILGDEGVEAEVTIH